MSETRILAVAGLGQAAAQLGTQVFDPPSLLTIYIRISGHSLLSAARIFFNNDQGNNYAFSVSESFALPSTGLSGSGINLASVLDGSPQGLTLLIGNGPNQTHAVTFSGMSGLLDGSVAPRLVQGAGIWTPTSQITSVQLDAGSVGGNLNAGTGILVVGTLT